jgi:hypothetical protein
MLVVLTRRGVYADMSEYLVFCLPAEMNEFIYLLLQLPLHLNDHIDTLQALHNIGQLHRLSHIQLLLVAVR